MVETEYAKRLVDSYTAKCKEVDCKINSRLLKSLKAATTALTELDLSMNYVGPKGLVPVMGLLAANATVGRLDLSNNGINDEVLPIITKTISEHTGIYAVNMSYNEELSQGKLILDMVRDNTNITVIQLDQTGIYDTLVERIMSQIKMNRELAKTKPNFVSLKSTPSRSKTAEPPSVNGRQSLFANPERWKDYVYAKEGWTSPGGADYRSPEMQKVLRHNQDLKDSEKLNQTMADRAERRVQEEDRHMDAMLGLRDQPTTMELKSLKANQEHLLQHVQDQRPAAESDVSHEAGVTLARQRQQEKWQRHLEAMEQEAALEEEMKQQRMLQKQIYASPEKPKEVQAAELARREEVEWALEKARKAGQEEVSVVTENVSTSPRFNHSHDFLQAMSNKDAVKSAQLDHDELSETQRRFRNQTVSEVQTVAENTEPEERQPQEAKTFLQSVIEPPAPEAEQQKMQQHLQRKKQDKDEEELHSRKVQEVFSSMLDPVCEEMRDEVLSVLQPNSKSGIPWEWEDPADEVYPLCVICSPQRPCLLHSAPIASSGSPVLCDFCGSA